MRILKVKAFSRFQRREGIPDTSLVGAVRDAASGLIDADLGDGLIKQRVARRGQGKRGQGKRSGYRTMIACKSGHRAVFLLGFAKSDRANIDDDELEELRRKGRAYLALSEEQIEALLLDEDLVEIGHGEEADEEG